MSSKMETKSSTCHVPPGWLTRPGGDKPLSQKTSVPSLELHHVRGQKGRQSLPAQNPPRCPPSQGAAKDTEEQKHSEQWLAQTLATVVAPSPGSPAHHPDREDDCEPQITSHSTLNSLQEQKNSVGRRLTQVPMGFPALERPLLWGLHLDCQMALSRPMEPCHAHTHTPLGSAS